MPKRGGSAMVKDDAVAVAMTWVQWQLGIVVVNSGSSKMVVII